MVPPGDDPDQRRTPAPAAVFCHLIGGDGIGRGDQPALSWWLPAGSARQQAYRIVTDDGYDTGRVESDQQTFITVTVFDRPRRTTVARVQVWTDLGESEFSGPVELDSTLLAESDWIVPWMTIPEPRGRAPKGERPAMWVRRVVEFPSGARVRAHVSALGIYELFVNGHRVGDIELAPGFTQYRVRVQMHSYDLTPLLRPGRNVVAVLVADGWYRGQVGLPRAADQFGTELHLRVQLEHGAGTGWSVLGGHPGEWLTTESHVVAADLIGGQREDLRLLDPAVHDPDAALDAWTPAIPEPVDVAVVRAIAPPIRRVEELHAVSVTPVRQGAPATGEPATLVTDQPDAVVVDLGQNINGWLRLRGLGPAGRTVTIRHGEHLDAAGDLTTAHLDVDVPIVEGLLPVGQVDAVTSRGDPDDAFEPRLTTHGFRYARIEGRPDLEVKDVRGVVVHSDLRRTGWFRCSDERINRLHEAAVWSLRGNMCGIPTDCPQRERAGWTGDWQVFASTAAFLYDVLAFSRSWLRDVAIDQRADGCVANMSPCPPGEGFDGPLAELNGSAGWGDAAVTVPWDLYQAYGDSSLLVESWPMLTRWVDYAAAAAAGGRHPDRAARRTEPRSYERYLWDTGFHWGEWLEPGADLSDFGAFVHADKSEVASAYLHRSAVIAARIGELIGADPQKIGDYRRIAEGARGAWWSEYADASGTLLPQTQAAHVRALAFGLAPTEHRSAIAARLAALVAEADDHLTTGFLSTGLLLPTLAANGHPGVAYALLRQDTEPSWLTMIDRRATTMWEQWNGVDADGVAHASLNHYSKGAVVSFLHHYVAGLQPLLPGYREFRVRPLLGGGLSWAAAQLDSPYGRIEITWENEPFGFALDVAVPPGTRCLIVPPEGPDRWVGPGEHRFTKAR
jgi:alpha-L-rhamnosidase